METINTVIFYILSILCVASGVFCLFQKNTLNAAISAMVLFFGISGLYFLLSAPFLGAAQLFLAGGGIGVLMLFSATLTCKEETAKSSKISLKTIGAPVVGAFFAIIIIPFILYGFGGIKTPITHTMQDFAAILYKNNALSFELIGILLFVVITGVCAILINKVHKIKNTRLIKTPGNKDSEWV